MTRWECYIPWLQKRNNYNNNSLNDKINLMMSKLAIIKVTAAKSAGIIISVSNRTLKFRQNPRHVWIIEAG